MNKYEVALVLSSTLTDEGRAAELDVIKGYIDKYQGVVTDVDEWGKRKLAYEINYISEGYYVLMKFTSGADFPAELDRILGITDGILRRLITLRAE